MGAVGGADSRVKQAVKAQGPYIPATVTTKSIRENLEKVLLQLKAGKQITVGEDVSGDDMLAANYGMAGPGGFAGMVAASTPPSFGFDPSMNPSSFDMDYGSNESVGDADENF